MLQVLGFLDVIKSYGLRTNQSWKNWGTESAKEQPREIDKPVAMEW